MRLVQDIQTPPAPPAPPQVPGAPTPVAGGVTVTAGELQQRPMTRADVEALKSKRSELSRQLNSAQGRRDEAAQQLRRSSSGPERTGIEQRLQVLDQRIVQLEQDIAANGRMLAAAPGALVAATESEGGVTNGFNAMGPGQLTAISIVFTLAVLMPMAIAFSRSLLRRTPKEKPSPQMLADAARLERMEQAIDSVAIEIERISEGQRFVTQLMAKRAEPVALGEGRAPAEPIKVARPEQVSFENR